MTPSTPAWSAAVGQGAVVLQFLLEPCSSACRPLLNQTSSEPPMFSKCLLVALITSVVESLRLLAGM
jgi:hypothetical protein